MNDSNTITARVTLATNLKRLRQELGLSQEKVAELAGIHRNYLGGIERCERNVGLDNLEKIAGALGVSPADLLKDI
ncbi:helix-turn-helix domain-containing protein [Rhizobium ruizarguesonis]|uniref:helix-turn-helix domain-containing protein n=1 Tax=Neorhizobium sp. SHOUNA12A TaxID=2908923 RepID=UPI002867D91F|nr:helix-turn-helix transcriptional regulator [Neorhizobium sp. SHOUNA12A]